MAEGYPAWKVIRAITGEWTVSDRRQEMKESIGQFSMAAMDLFDDDQIVATFAEFQGATESLARFLENLGFKPNASLGIIQGLVLTAWKVEAP